MPRKTMFIRGIVLAAVVAAAVSACTPPLPPDVLAAQAENTIKCQKGDQPVAIPEDFAGAMAPVSANLAGVCPDQSISEVAAGDPASLQIVDSAPTPDEIAAFQSTCSTGSVIVVPAFGYGVALAYNIIGLEGLVLTPQVTAGILSGAITSWEDPAIAEANPGVDLTALPDIAVASVEEPTGSVEAMTTWLTKEAPADWKSGVTGTLETGTKFPTTADLIGELTATEGTVAVLPIAEAVANAVPVASVPVKDLVIAPDDGQLQKVGVGATNVTKDDKGNMLASPAVGGVPVQGNFDLAASKIVLASGQPLIGWPIVGIAHMMVCDDAKDPLPLSTAQYIVRLAGQGGLEASGLTPLPEPIRIQTFTPLKVTIATDGATIAPSGGSPAPSGSTAAPASVQSSPPASPAAS
jgi:ABC-type phosphate transport system substrate-binding protein